MRKVFRQDLLPTETNTLPCIPYVLRITTCQGENMGERERLLAHYYELEYGEYVEDVEFYVQYATALDPERGLPVLELGCGTGRIAVALALAGFRVVGVDSSPEMLQVCDGKARAAGVQDKVT